MDATEQRVREIVAGLQTGQALDVEVVDCDPDLADTAQFIEAYGYEAEDSANTIIVVGKSDPPVYVACVVLATTRLDVNKTVRKRLGVRKCSFAPSELTTELTGMMVGGVTPLGLPEDIPLWIDSRVMARERILIGGGSRSCKVVGSPLMLTQQAQAEVVNDLAKEIPVD